MKFVPIIQAPMAGVTTPKLAAAVSNAGGIGSLGLAGQSLSNVKKLIQETQMLTKYPINVNFFQYTQPALQSNVNKEWIKALSPLFKRANIEPPHDLDPVYSPVNQELVDLLVELKPAIASFHFGVLDPKWGALLQGNGTKIWVTVTNIEEAIQAQDSGADALVVQGIEAGGHRGTFDPTAKEDPQFPTTDLVKLLRKRFPDSLLIAAGGIMNGQDIQAALNAGANMVQLGTAFIGCPESAANDSYRQRLLSSQETLLHNVVSGRYARGFHNEFVDYCLELDGVAPFPYAYDAQKQLAKHSSFVNQWAGQHHAKARIMPAAELVNVLVKEAHLSPQESIKFGFK